MALDFPSSPTLKTKTTYSQCVVVVAAVVLLSLLLGVNSIENFWLEFRLEKSLEFWLEIPHTLKMFKNWIV